MNKYIILILILIVLFLNNKKKEHLVESTNGSVKEAIVNLSGIMKQNSLVPSGVIVAWSGNLNDIPKGWILCDGTNGTPDLVDRFIMGTDNQCNSSNCTDGGKPWTMTVAQMPKHKHTFNGPSHFGGGNDTRHMRDYSGPGYEKLHITNETGSGESIPNST